MTFRLHDKTRRRICIASFLLLGALPTLCASAWCIGRHLPSCVRAESRELALQLGLDVKLERVSYVRPGAVLYHGVELADPETGQILLRSRLLEIVNGRETDEHGQPQPMLTLTASQPQIDAAAIPRVWRWLQTLMTGQLSRTKTLVQLSAPELTLQAAAGAQTLTNLEGLVENLPGGTHAQLHFRLVGADTPEPARIRLVRNRQVSPPASGFELYTGGGELPCNVLAMAMAELKPLGPRCRFRGYIWANESPDGWEGEVTGQLVDLDLGSLVTDHFPHHMSGAGELTVQSARFRQGRLDEGSGLLVAGPGTIDRSLLAAAVEHLGLQPASDLLPRPNTLRPDPEEDQQAGPLVPYQQLALSVTLDSQGLRIRGRCTDSEPGVVLSDGRHRMLSEPKGRPRPVAALVQTLVPQSVVQVPASRQTDWLLRHLPIPAVVSPTTAETARPVAHPRLPEAWRR